MLAQLRVAAREACSELGLALVEDRAGVAHARVEVALGRGGPVVELAHAVDKALLEGFVLVLQGAHDPLAHSSAGDVGGLIEVVFKC